jgi:hypothetical protein
MFAMVHGPWPRPPDATDELDAALERAVRAQVEAGIDLVADPHVPWLRPAVLADALASGDPAGLVVNAWRRTNDVASAVAPPDLPQPTVAAAITGPFTLARGTSSRGDVLRAGVRLHEVLVRLAEAGCSMVVVDEPTASEIGADVEARRQFREAHASLLGDAPPLHAMLAVTGGSAWEAGAETILDAPYASYLLDLIAGPDNWYLARAIPGERGIVCAALRAPSRADQAPALVWAANYAASMNGRGLDRVGLANASPLGGHDEAEATAAAAALARAARLASMDPKEAIAAGLDRRTFGQPPERHARPRLPRA